MPRRRNVGWGWSPAERRTSADPPSGSSFQVINNSKSQLMRMLGAVPLSSPIVIAIDPHYMLKSHKAEHAYEHVATLRHRRLPELVSGAEPIVEARWLIATQGKLQRFQQT